MMTASHRRCTPTLLLAAALLACLAGCSSTPTSPDFEVAPNQYALAFDATRDVLRDYHFQLDRVDAAAGVITTLPKSTGGVATPWDSDQSSVGQEFDDLLNLQRRIVRVTFNDDDGARATGDTVDPALAMHARVEVTIYRMQTPGLRPSSRAIGMTSATLDPQAVAQGTGYAYEVPISQDSRLGARIAADIERRTGRMLTAGN